MMMMTKAEENRLRRVAERQGLTLRKSRSRDPRVPGYGLYALIDPVTGGTIHPNLANFTPFALDADDVRWWLEEDKA